MQRLTPHSGTRRLLRFAVIGITLTCSIACTAEEVLRVVGPGTVIRLDLVPESTTLFVGQRTFLTARLNGLPLAGDLTTWRSSDPAVATVAWYSATSAATRASIR